NRGLFDAGQKTRYVEALIAEIRRAPALDSSSPAGPSTRSGSTRAEPEVDTIYFGGGTPSLLEPCEVERIVDACLSTFDVAPDREVTLEANPESVDEQRLAGYLAAGVNRLSFGVQSFRNAELRRLTLLHTA